LCLATTGEEAIAASRTVRENLKAHAVERQKKYCIQKIAVSGKGGVGKSTSVSLLANALKEYGYNVLVIDTDESNPGLSRMFGFDNQPKPLMTILPRFSFDDPEPNAEWLTNDEIAVDDIPPEFLLRDGSLCFMMAGNKIQRISAPGF